MFFLGFGVTVFWIENTRFLAIFAQILLVAIAILTIFDQIVATATTASVDFFFDYHDYSLLETFSLSHYPENFIFHLWSLQPKPKLIIVEVEKLMNHIPKNQGDGQWESTSLPYSAFIIT